MAVNNQIGASIIEKFLSVLFNLAMLCNIKHFYLDFY
jgi:hypothetical protein